MPYQSNLYHLRLYISPTSLLILITFLSFDPPLSQSSSSSSSSSSSNESYNGSPLPTTAIIIVSVVFTVGIAICYIRHLIACFRSYIFGTHTGEATGLRRRDTPRGLDPEVIATFPTFSFSDVKLHLATKTTPLECAICIFEFVDQDLLRLLPTCSHVFHPQCIAPWFSSHSTCPVCRANLEILPDNHTNPIESFAHQLSLGDQSEPSDQEHVTPPHHRADVILQISETPDHNMIINQTPSSAVHKSSNGVGERIGSFQRSHSTGHSLGENRERFTLRLSQEVRNKLVIVNNNNNNFNELSPNSLVSPRFGYRASSVSSTSAAMSVKPDKWRFTMSPPFISRPGSSPDIAGSSNNNNNVTGIMRSPKSCFKSTKSPSKSQLNRVVKCDVIGERSSDQLWPNRTSQEVGLENH